MNRPNDVTHVAALNVGEFAPQEDESIIIALDDPDATTSSSSRPFGLASPAQLTSFESSSPPRHNAPGNVLDAEDPFSPSFAAFPAPPAQNRWLVQKLKKYSPLALDTVASN